MNLAEEVPASEQVAALASQWETFAEYVETAQSELQAVSTSIAELGVRLAKVQSEMLRGVGDAALFVKSELDRVYGGAFDGLEINPSLWRLLAECAMKRGETVGQLLNTLIGERLTLDPNDLLVLIPAKDASELLTYCKGHGCKPADVVREVMQRDIELRRLTH